MDVMSTLKPILRNFLKRLRADYPQFKFQNGHRENWSPHTKTVTFSAKQPERELKFGVLHELAHALLEHKDYTSDLELLKLESEAWHLAAKLGRKYQVKISENHIQNCLDTYRDWLHKRSRCPNCGVHVIQHSPSTYKCFNCGLNWRVSHERFARPYRMTHRWGNKQ